MGWPTWLAVVGMVLGLAVLVAWVVAAWIASERIRREALLGAHSRVPPQFEVVEVTEERLTLRKVGRRAPRVVGAWGVAGDGWYARISEGERVASDVVRYRQERVAGTPLVGQSCALDARAVPAKGTPPGMEAVTFSGPLGLYPAWLAPGGTTWVIGVHGKSGGPYEVARSVAAASAAGCSVLVPFYRNDDGVAPSEDGYFHFGRSEWEDLEAAVQFALAQGAQRVVLSGHSMGAAIVGWFLRRSDLATQVSALVLDAPLLDFRTAVAWTARTTGVPAPVTWLGLLLGRVRFGLRWTDYDVRPAFARAALPLLLLHGDADGQVPVALSERFAEGYPGEVRVERFPDAGHGQAWNLDRARYDALVTEFLVRRTGTEAETLAAG